MQSYINEAGNPGALSIYNLDTRSRSSPWHSGYFSLKKIPPALAGSMIWLQSRSRRDVGHRISSVPAGNRTQVFKPVTTLETTYQRRLQFFFSFASWKGNRNRNYEHYVSSYHSSTFLVFGSIILKFVKSRK